MTHRDAHPRTGHMGPAPGRRRVGALMLVFTFMLAPVAWGAQLVAISSLAGFACIGPNDVAGVWAPLTWAEPAIRWINAAALLLAIVGVCLSLLNMRRSQKAMDPRTGPVAAGEGRVHWMAFGGLFVALVSAIAIIANTIMVFGGGLCPV